MRIVRRVFFRFTSEFDLIPYKGCYYDNTTPSVRGISKYYKFLCIQLYVTRREIRD